jgi:hypothetical protein
MHGTFLSFPRGGDSVVFAGLEQAQNLAGKDIRRHISDPFSRCRVCGKLSQIVKAIRRKRESQMSIRGRAAVGVRGYNAAELRQKAREWLAKSAVNRIREDPESE